MGPLQVQVQDRLLLEPWDAQAAQLTVRRAQPQLAQQPPRAVPAVEVARPLEQVARPRFEPPPLSRPGPPSRPPPTLPAAEVARPLGQVARPLFTPSPLPRPGGLPMAAEPPPPPPPKTLPAAGKRPPARTPPPPPPREAMPAAVPKKQRPLPLPVAAEPPPPPPQHPPPTKSPPRLPVTVAAEPPPPPPPKKGPPPLPQREPLPLSPPKAQPPAEVARPPSLSQRRSASPPPAETVPRVLAERGGGRRPALSAQGLGEALAGERTIWFEPLPRQRVIVVSYGINRRGDNERFSRFMARTDLWVAANMYDGQTSSRDAWQIIESVKRRQLEVPGRTAVPRSSCRSVSVRGLAACSLRGGLVACLQLGAWSRRGKTEGTRKRERETSDAEGQRERESAEDKQQARGRERTRGWANSALNTVVRQAMLQNENFQAALVRKVPGVGGLVACSQCAGLVACPQLSSARLETTGGDRKTLRDGERERESVKQITERRIAGHRAQHGGRGVLHAGESCRTHMRRCLLLLGEAPQRGTGPARLRYARRRGSRFLVS